MVSWTPNIEAGGRRRRQALGVAGVVMAVVLLAWFIASGATWSARLLVGIPAGIGAIGLLQAARGTCVARAAQGAMEHDDHATSPMAGAELAASRGVARSIVRDTVLVAIGAALLAAATAFIVKG